MKHLRTQETSGALLISFLIYYLVFAPIVFDINLAQSLDTTPPVLAHHPAKMGYLGKSLRLTAHVADLSDIESVTMTINYAGKTVTGNVPPKKGIGDVPVLVQAINNLDVRGGPGSRYKLRGNVRNGEQLAVTGIKGEHYRIRSSRNVTGFVQVKDTKAILWGKVYGVSIPARITSNPQISYQISVTDIHGNKTTSDLYQVRLLTEEEVAALAAKRGIGKKRSAQAAPARSQERKSDRSFAVVWILAGLAVVGGGAYYLLSKQKDKDDTATVDVIVGWE